MLVYQGLRQEFYVRVSAGSQIRLRALFFATEPIFLCRRAYLRTGALHY
ncbi:MAG: hypothetical protein JOZ78_06585 [Chroococcidiopsidaceae cyanobacterium CP_BM_ER_R8_30]|nr:hypothetical protein [Chroococcidiopsidaceae cyanobacterium CP_BM_ER_R8_30]